jgi:hypothetical protein
MGPNHLVKKGIVYLEDEFGLFVVDDEIDFSLLGREHVIDRCRDIVDPEISYETGADQIPADFRFEVANFMKKLVNPRYRFRRIPFQEPANLGSGDDIVPAQFPDTFPAVGFRLGVCRRKSGGQEKKENKNGGRFFRHGSPVNG